MQSDKFIGSDDYGKYPNKYTNKKIANERFCKTWFLDFDFAIRHGCKDFIHEREPKIYEHFEQQLEENIENEKSYYEQYLCHGPMQNMAA